MIRKIILYILSIHVHSKATLIAPATDRSRLMLCPRVRNFHEGTKFTKKKIGCDGGFGGANFAEEWGHTRDWGGCKLGVRGGFSPRRKDAKFGWRASVCPRITRMSRIPHATRPSRRRAYTSLLLYCLLSIFYLLTQVDHERHESHERFFLGQQSAPRHHQRGGFC